MNEVTHPFPQRFQEALLYAATHHAGQLRKGTGVPYITHPLIVSETLAYHYPGRHDLILAGVLHDVIEDTESTFAEVEAQFGTGVARLVAAVTKPDDHSDLPTERVAKWRFQRQAMIDALKDEHEDVFRLKAADSLANLRAIRRDLETPGVGESVWSRFKVGRDESLWYYESVLELMEGIASEPLVSELRRELEWIQHSATETTALEPHNLDTE
jgi:(p)ppGpp synthase/HD superfamily hydrolase